MNVERDKLQAYLDAKGVDVQVNVGETVTVTAPDGTTTELTAT